ncbi:MAG: hypothetical protein PHI85_05075 [Victivallaceae bacterium]|nr:hypothetical protein [Victivallaceae bacterium]
MSSELKNFSDYANLDYLIVIPSKGRAKNIDAVQAIFPNAVLFVHEDELADYKKSSTLPIITHNRTHGYGDVVNAIFSECANNKIRYVAVFDDDKARFSSMVGNHERRLTTEQVEQAIVNGCQVMEDMDCYLYLFSTASSIIKYQQSEPFKVGFSLPQGAFIARSEKIGRFRVGMHHYEDFDFCMDYIAKYRYMIIEMRFLCISNGQLNSGGCNSFRSSDNERSSREYVIKKWKNCVRFVKNAGGVIRPMFAGSRVQK